MKLQRCTQLILGTLFCLFVLNCDSKKTDGLVSVNEEVRQNGWQYFLNFIPHNDSLPVKSISVYDFLKTFPGLNKPLYSLIKTTVAKAKKNNSFSGASFFQDGSFQNEDVFASIEQLERGMFNLGCIYGESDSGLDIIVVLSKNAMNQEGTTIDKLRDCIESIRDSGISSSIDFLYTIDESIGNVMKSFLESYIECSKKGGGKVGIQETLYSGDSESQDDEQTTTNGGNEESEHKEIVSVTENEDGSITICYDNTSTDCISMTCKSGCDGTGKSIQYTTDDGSGASLTVYYEGNTKSWMDAMRQSNYWQASERFWDKLVSGAGGSPFVREHTGGGGGTRGDCIDDVSCQSYSCYSAAIVKAFYEKMAAFKWKSCNQNVDPHPESSTHRCFEILQSGRMSEEDIQNLYVEWCNEKQGVASSSGPEEHLDYNCNALQLLREKNMSIFSEKHKICEDPAAMCLPDKAAGLNRVGFALKGYGAYPLNKFFDISDLEPDLLELVR